MGRTAERLSQEKPKQSFFGGIKDDIAKRYEEMGRIADITKIPGGTSDEAEQEFASGVFQIAGKSAALLGDVVGRGLSAVIPDPIERAAGAAIGSVANTAPAKKALEEYQQFKQKYPEVAANIEAGVNIVTTTGIPKVAGVALKTSSTVAGRTGRALENSGKQALIAEKAAFAYRLVKPLDTAKNKIEAVGRTAEKGFGPLRRSVVAPSLSEISAQKAILKVPGISPKKSLKQNYNIIRDYNVELARQLEGTLKKNDFIFPKKELASRLRSTKEELARSPLLVGDEAKIADKLISELERRINLAGAKGSELLKVRKDYDDWVKKQKPRVFDGRTESAFTVTNREVRRTINEFLDEKAPSARVRQSLKEQSSLYNSLDNLAPKAALEANTAIVRALQNVFMRLGVTNKLAQQLITASGILSLGGGAVVAPALAGLGVGSLVVYKAGKYILSPSVRTALGKALKEYDMIVGQGASREILDQIENAVKSLDEMQ